ncbi:DUF3054 domain-containing protein [Agromyces bauzanensis]
MSERRRIGTTGILGALVIDVLLVVVFAIVGRVSHAEGLTLAGVWGTAWPFLAGLAVGWAAARAWRHPFAVWPTGVAVWAAALVVGMLLRLVSGQGTAVAFVVVAALTLALLLVGWRAVALLVARGRRAPA